MLHGHRNKSGGSYNLGWPFLILQQGGAQGPDHTGWNPMPWAYVVGRTMAPNSVHILTPKPATMSPFREKGTLQMGFS